MGEYEAGKPYLASDGKLYVWSGQGDAKDKKNWSLHAPEAAAPAPSIGPDDKNARAKRAMKNRGDIPAFSGHQIMAALGLAAPMMIPEMAGAAGVAARIGANAAGGAVMGAGLADEGQTAEGAKSGAVVGLGAGAFGEAVAPALRVAARSASGRGARLADWLREATDAKDWGAAMDKIRASLRTVQKTLYEPIEGLPVPHPEVAQILTEVEARNWLPRGMKGKVPTVKELQDLRSNLKGKLKNTPDFGIAERLDEVMKANIPGLEQADKAYFVEQQRRRAMVMGARNARKPGAEIEQAAKNFAPEYQQAFREGVVHRWASNLAERDNHPVAALAKLMDAGPETKRVFATMFPDEGSYNAFMGEVAKEKSAARISAAFKKTSLGVAKWLGHVVGPAIGAAAGVRYGMQGQESYSSEQP